MKKTKYKTESFEKQKQFNCFKKKKKLNYLLEFLFFFGKNISFFRLIKERKKEEERVEEKYPIVISLVSKMEQVNKETKVMYYVGEYLFYLDQKELGMMWMKKAAQRGHAQAQFFMGCEYHSGIIMTQNFEEAVKW